MLAAGLQDIDGLGKIISEDAFYDYHHIVGHNLFVGLLLAGVLTIFSHARIKAFCVYLGLFHLHLLMDIFGSGPKWTIMYLWPLSKWEAEYRHAWKLYSWQNLTTFFALLIWTLIIVVVKKRTPLEYPMPKLDKQLVDLAKKWTRR